MTSPWKGKSLALASWISVTGDDAFGLVSIDRAQDQSLSVSIGHRDRRAVASEGAHPNPAKVSGFVIDAGRRQVVAVTVKGSKAGDVIEWAAITAFGADAVAVPSESAIPAAGGPIRDLADKDHRIMGKLRGRDSHGLRGWAHSRPALLALHATRPGAG